MFLAKVKYCTLPLVAGLIRRQAAPTLWKTKYWYILNLIYIGMLYVGSPSDFGIDGDDNANVWNANHGIANNNWVNNSDGVRPVTS